MAAAQGEAPGEEQVWDRKLKQPRGQFRMVSNETQINLNNLLTTLQIIIGDSEYLNVYEDKDEREYATETLHNNCRKLAWFQFLQQESPIVITGVQGAGKSTFATKLFNLPQDFLPCREGRGEMVPFVIRENPNIKEPERYLLTVAKSATQGRNEKYLEKIDDVRFNSVIMQAQGIEQVNENSVSASDVAKIPLIEVPEKTGLNRTFLVMPGIEFDNDESWQETLNFILNNTSNWVMVTDETRLAHRDNLELFKSLKEKNLKYEPVIVCSKSENFSDEKKDQLKKVVRADIGSENVQVVFTEKDNLEWKNTVINLLDDYSKNNRVAMWKSLKPIIKEIAPIARTIKSEYASNAISNTIAANNSMKGYLEKYDSRVTEIKEIFGTTIDKVIDGWANEWERTYQEKAPSFWQRIRDTIKLNEAKKRADYKDFIKKIWNAQGLKDRIDDALQEEAFKQIAIEYKKLSAEDPLITNVKGKRRTVKFDASLKKQDLSYAADLALLAYAGYHHVDGRDDDNINLTEELFPCMKKEIKETNKTTLDSLKEDKKAAIAMLGFFVDGSDGSLDVAKSAMDMLGIPLSVAPQIFGGLGAVLLFKKGWDAARCAVLNNLNETEKILNALKSNAKKEYRVAFDKLLNEERRFLEVRLKDCLGLTNLDEKSFAVAINSNRLLDTCGELQRSITLETAHALY